MKWIEVYWADDPNGGLMTRPLVALRPIGHAEVIGLLEQPVLRAGSGRFCEPQGIERLSLAAREILIA